MSTNVQMSTEYAPIDYERARVMKLQEEVTRLQRLLDKYLHGRGRPAKRSPNRKGKE